MSLLVFDYTVSDIFLISDKIINNHKKWFNNIKSNKNISPDDFLDSYLYDELNNFDYIYNTIIFLRYVSINKEIREASSKFDLKIKKYFLDFYKSSENYDIFKILKKININKYDKNNTKKLIKNILKNFEDNGCALNEKNKKKLSDYQNKLINLETKFSNNIMSDIKEIKFKKNELEGINNILLKSHYNSKIDKYIFNTTYPDQNSILTNCNIEKSRQIMYNKFNNVAPKNINILKNILILRYKISKIFGFKNTVSYYFSDNRLASEEKINKLLNKLIPILKKKVIIENKNLELMKKNKINNYDVLYYSNLYKKKYLDIDHNIIKEYFPSTYTIPKILNIYSKIFSLNIKLLKKYNKNNIWHKDVEIYKVSDSKNKKIIGYFYLDLYPRLDKYTHAASFDLQNSYYDKNNKRIIPFCAIVCNFTKIDKSIGNALFNFNEIETFCHEFGHALHYLLSDVKYELLSGIKMEDDFAEMPSQFFENWCYNKKFLKIISSHYITKKRLPNKIINNIILNRNYNNSIHYLTQILYIKYDLEIHKKNYKMITEKYLHKLWFNILKKLLPFKYSENIYPMCRFDHLMGYQVQYYGYLWSIIYSYDAFSIFEKEGIFNKNIGMKFRKEILEKGGIENAEHMLENFLDRKISNNSFFSIF
jgi:Zn-dependent oligopeptidase